MIFFYKGKIVISPLAADIKLALLNEFYALPVAGHRGRNGHYNE